MTDDYITLATMFTVAHGHVEFVCHGNGVQAMDYQGRAIPRTNWSASMHAVVGGFPADLVYWEKKYQEYRERGYR